MDADNPAIRPGGSWGRVGKLVDDSLVLGFGRSFPELFTHQTPSEPHLSSLQTPDGQTVLASSRISLEVLPPTAICLSCSA